MNRELITVIEQIGREKGIDKEILFEALESALLSASRKTLGPADNVRMHIDRKSGDLRVYCRKKVVEEVTDDKLEISLADAKALNQEAELGDELELEQERPPQEFGRIAAQTAKQVILQKVRDAEREGIYSEFAGKEGQILRGVVHRIEKRNVILEIGKAEAILPEREQIPGERRSEEHTSELQSLAYLVCRLLLEKKKKLYEQPPVNECDPSLSTGYELHITT